MVLYLKTVKTKEIFSRTENGRGAQEWGIRKDFLEEVTFELNFKGRLEVRKEGGKAC